MSKTEDGTIIALEKTHNQIYDFIEKKVGKNSTIIDLGCGHGTFLKKLNKDGYKMLYGADVLKRKGVNNKHFRFYKLDLDKKLPHEFNRKFNCVIAIEVIEHLLSPFYFLKNVNRILKKEGFFIFSTPNISSKTSRLLFLIYGRPRYFINPKFIKKGIHISPLFLYNLKELLLEAGFSVEKIESVTDENSIKDYLLYLFSSLLSPFMIKNRELLQGNSITIIAKKL